MTPLNIIETVWFTSLLHCLSSIVCIKIVTSEEIVATGGRSKTAFSSTVFSFAVFVLTVFLLTVFVLLILLITVCLLTVFVLSDLRLLQRVVGAKQWPPNLSSRHLTPPQRQPQTRSKII